MEETCIDLPYCCVLPVVTLRVLTAADFAAGALPTRTRFAESLVVVYLPAARRSRIAHSCCAIRLCRCYGYRAGRDALSARRCAPSLRRHDLGQVLGNLFALFFLRVRLTVRLPYRDAARRVGLARPPSQSAFTRSQCVGPHATYPASCAVRMRPSSLSWRRSQPRNSVRVRSQAVSTRTFGQNRPQTQWISRVQRPQRWVALYLIRFRKRPHHFAAVTEGFSLGKAIPSMVLFRRVDALCRAVGNSEE